MSGKIPFDIYRTWLPDHYNDKLDVERCDLVDQIKEELRKALHSETGTYQCCILLRRFYSFRFELTEEEKMYIIKSLLVLIFEKPDIDLKEQTYCAEELSKILSKATHLPNLIISWR